MSTSNLDDRRKSIWLETTDSKVLHTGFAEFVEIYKDKCLEGDNDSKLKTDNPQSEMSSQVELSNVASSLNSKSTLVISDSKRGVEDVGFNRFLDEWVSKIQKDAESNWMKMSKRERALFAPKDDIGRGTSSSILSSVAKGFIAGEESGSAIKMACDKICLDLVKRRYLKPKSLQSKSTGHKPWAAKKPKSQKKGLKPKAKSSPSCNIIN